MPVTFETFTDLKPKNCPKPKCHPFRLLKNSICAVKIITLCSKLTLYPISSKCYSLPHVSIVFFLLFVCFLRVFCVHSAARTTNNPLYPHRVYSHIRTCWIAATETMIWGNGIFFYSKKKSSLIHSFTC